MQESVMDAGIYFVGKTSNELSNQKGFYGEMNLLSTSQNNNNAIIEVSNTNKAGHAHVWLLKANGFYGSSNLNLPNRASFGVLGNGNVMINGDLNNNDQTKANLVVNDFVTNVNNGTGGNTTIYVTSKNSLNGSGIKVDSESSQENAIGIITNVKGTETGRNMYGYMTNVTSDSDPGFGLYGYHANVVSINGEQETTGMIINAKNSNSANTGAEIFATGNNLNSTNVGINVGAINNGITNIGVRTHANGASCENMAIYALAHGPGINYGIFASAHSGSEDYAARFQGSVLLNGSLLGSNNVLTTSDINLKTNIEDFSANEIIKKLKPQTFYYDTIQNYGLNLSPRKQYGFIAQQVDTILPELVFFPPIQLCLIL